ncbi:MAG: hypothetical protein HQK53_12120, partial [Oligoflexia bacterium]|nr:hypothetical protein [Oligoflexia bacterium]
MKNQDIKNLLILYFLLSVCLCQRVVADTDIYLQNNTPIPLELKIMQEGSKLKRKKWIEHRQAMPSWAPRTKILSLNRNRGIKWGEKYLWKIKLVNQNNGKE